MTTKPWRFRDSKFPTKLESVTGKKGDIELLKRNEKRVEDIKWMRPWVM